MESEGLEVFLPLQVILDSNSSLADNTSFGNDTTNEELRLKKQLYIIISAVLVTLCMISVAVNVVILMSLCWIRRPISPTLHISLSLAGSDMYTSFIFGFGLVVNSLIPVGLEMDEVFSNCFTLFLEGIRMGGVFTTMGHLLALAGNHYLGITKPLHYPSIMTHRNISVCSFFLWTVPGVCVLIYFRVVEDDGFANPNCTHRFLMKTKFRSGCSYILLGCLVLMAAIYCHIYTLVRKHQAARNRFRRMGSSYARSNQNVQGNMTTEQHQTQSRNEKALRTTMLIVGSVVLGWLPATTYFYLVCEDCPIPVNWGSTTELTITNSLINFLLILKTALNSYIYAARMHEIKAAMKRMRIRLVWACCRFMWDESQEMGLNSEMSRNHLSRTSTRRSRPGAVGLVPFNNSSLRTRGQREERSTPL